MRSSGGLTSTILVGVVVAVGVLRLDLGAAAQVDAIPAAPPLIEEVSSLVSEHFYDRGAVERVWAGDSSWMAVMLEIMGEQDGLAFMKKLAAKDLYMP